VSAVSAEAQGTSILQVLQLLLVVLALAGVLLLPALGALVPNFNGHILPSAPYKARLDNLTSKARILELEVCLLVQTGLLIFS
jgi:hypothetical protein